MGRPIIGYQIDGQKVPGVTTITGRFKDSGALIAWAYNQGKEGKDFRETRDSAADAGTCVHEMVEADWHGKAIDRSAYKPDVLAKADHAFLGYLEWKRQTNLSVIKPELSLVSRKHRFGGCLDAVMVGANLCLGDWKSSNGIYPDMLIQVAGGYALLWEEHFPAEPLHGIQIIRFSKPKEADDPISFHHHYYSAEIIPFCQRQFLLWRESYDLDKRIKSFV